MVNQGSTWTQWGKGVKKLRSTVGGGQCAGTQEPPRPKRIYCGARGKEEELELEAFSGGAHAS